MIYEEMRLRKTGEVVRVYSIADGTAMVFNPSLYQKQDNGWQKLTVGQLVPMDFPIRCRDYTSKTKRNKAKEKLKIVTATWKGSDGMIWDHSQMEEAIQHELELMGEICCED